MTGRQEMFCREYVIDYNGTQAAIRAKYSEKTAYSQAHDLLKKPEILSRIRELQHEQTERLAITADRVLTNLWDTYQRCTQAVPVMKWDYDEHEMVETGEYQFDSKGALRALELIGKHIGMFVDKLQVTQQPPSITDDLGGAPGG
ncbi:MAG: terminase small subunit [Eubacteriales bacterium]|nr:terminase small subunit [Eubacteriales bacterium]